MKACYGACMSGYFERGSRSSVQSVRVRQVIRVCRVMQARRIMSAREIGGTDPVTVPPVTVPPITMKTAPQVTKTEHAMNAQP